MGEAQLGTCRKSCICCKCVLQQSCKYHGFQKSHAMLWRIQLPHTRTPLAN